MEPETPGKERPMEISPEPTPTREAREEASRAAEEKKREKERTRQLKRQAKERLLKMKEQRERAEQQARERQEQEDRRRMPPPQTRVVSIVKAPEAPGVAPVPAEVFRPRGEEGKKPVPHGFVTFAEAEKEKERRRKKVSPKTARALRFDDGDDEDENGPDPGISPIPGPSRVVVDGPQTPYLGGGGASARKKTARRCMERPVTGDYIELVTPLITKKLPYFVVSMPSVQDYDNGQFVRWRSYGFPGADRLSHADLRIFIERSNSADAQKRFVPRMLVLSLPPTPQDTPLQPGIDDVRLAVIPQLARGGKDVCLFELEAGLGEEWNIVETPGTCRRMNYVDKSDAFSHIVVILLSPGSMPRRYIFHRPLPSE